VWDLAASHEDAILPVPGGHRIIDGRYLRDGRLAAVTVIEKPQASDREITVRDMTANLELARLKHDLETYPKATISSDGLQVAFAAPSHVPCLWSVSNRRVRDLTNDSHEGIYHFAFSPDGKYVAAACSHGSLQIWDAASGQQVASVQAGKQNLRHVCFSDDGGLVAAVADDGLAWVWDLCSRRAPRFFGPLVLELAMCGFSHDRRYLAASGQDGRVELWNLTTGAATTIETGHEPPIDGFAFTPDGLTLATSGLDSEVRLWNLESRHEMAVLPLTSPIPLNRPVGQYPNVRNGTVSFSPNGRRLAAFTPILARIYDTRPPDPATRSGNEQRASSSALTHR
jgi:WD40 repeat protein